MSQWIHWIHLITVLMSCRLCKHSGVVGGVVLEWDKEGHHREEKN